MDAEKAKEWVEKVRKYKQSGQSQRVWSRENGGKRSTLRYWIERVDEIAVGKEISFAELVISGDQKW